MRAHGPSLLLRSWSLALAVACVGACEGQAPEPSAPADQAAAAPAVPELPMTSKTSLHPALHAHVQEHVLPAVAEIPAERRVVLAHLASFVSERREAGVPAALTFICTHNSRRSQLGQVWAATAAAWFGVEGVQTFSGGTEVTAFNPRAVQALRRGGFEVTTEVGGADGDNPRYEVSMGPERAPLPAHSKRYDDEPNPQEGFAAIMTCTAADASCPTVRGASLRLALPYDDPKEADGTPAETTRYDERSRQIAAEMFYLFALVRS